MTAVPDVYKRQLHLYFSHHSFPAGQPLVIDDANLGPGYRSSDRGEKLPLLVVFGSQDGYRRGHLRHSVSLQELASEKIAAALDEVGACGLGAVDDEFEGVCGKAVFQMCIRDRSRRH